MLVIDAHTHWYPGFVSQDPCAWAKRNAEAHWGALMAPRADGKKNLQSFPSIENFLRDMDDAQVDRAVIQGWYWEKQSNCDLLNEAIAFAIKPFADRLSAFCSINPASGDVEGKLRRAKDMGFIGIGELHDSVQGFTFDSENFAALCGKAAEYRMPVSIHLSDSSGKDYPNKTETDNAAIYAAAKNFPDTKFILAHWGGGEVFKEGFKFLPNVFYDVAANSFLYGKDAWRKIKGPLTDKIIYGSDYPLRLYPSHSTEAEMALFIEEAKDYVAPENYEKFFSTNFLFLYEK